MRRLRLLLGVLMLVVLPAAQRCRAADLADFMADGKPHGQAIQEALDSFVDPTPGWPNQSGGELRFGRGQFNVTEPIIVPCGGITIRGAGGLGTMVCVVNWRGEGALFEFASPSYADHRGGVRFVDIQFRGNKKNTAFLFTAADSYARPWIFDRVAAKYFGCVFDFRRGKKSTWGGVQCAGSEFTHNGQVMKATSDPTTHGTANLVSFRDCLLSKNCQGTDKYAFDFCWTTGIEFTRCVVEAQPRFLRCRHVVGVTLEGCHYESNIVSGVRDPVTLFDRCRTLRFAGNVHSIVQIERVKDAPATVHIKDCRDFNAPAGLRKVLIETTSWKVP